jgi:hypothetical protein
MMYAVGFIFGLSEFFQGLGDHSAIRLLVGVVVMVWMVDEGVRRA